MSMKLNLPVWVEKLLVKAIKEYVPASLIAEYAAEAKAEVLAYLKGMAAKTDNTIDDAAVAMVEDAFSKCNVDGNFLCDLIARGEVAVVEFLRAAAQKSETSIDDAVVDLIAEAMGLKAA